MEKKKSMCRAILSLISSTVMYLSETFIKSRWHVRIIMLVCAVDIRYIWKYSEEKERMGYTDVCVCVYYIYDKVKKKRTTCVHRMLQREGRKCTRMKNKMIARVMLPPNCMPDGNCIFHTLTVSLCTYTYISFSLFSFPLFIRLWQQYLRVTHTSRQHASPETWRKKRYCTTPQSFPVLGAHSCSLPLPSSSASVVFTSASITMRILLYANRLHYTMDRNLLENPNQLTFK